MNNKLRQVTDAIHGTIYLSKLESEFISTPYFYRLHDIYQSSTVYLTFPSNRTKRYEHSLGTMEIASNMLFSAVSNADIPTRDRFFKSLYENFKKVYSGVMKSHDLNAAYLFKAAELLDELLEDNGNERLDPEKFLRNEIKTAYRDGFLNDSALDQYQFYAVSTTQDRDYSGLRDSFLYKCILEAVRLVALFHDVGHPPYSHIIESVMNDLYKEVVAHEAEFIADRAQIFKNSLSPFMSSAAESSFQCKMILSISSLIGADTHERIGLALFQSAINEVIPEQIKEIWNNSSIRMDVKRALIIYYVTVVEFAMAILTEISPLFYSLHKIVDGYVDADRLDYVVRDSVNSGVDWGIVPYKRLIQSCKMFYIDEIFASKDVEGYFSIAFPKKNTDDISDLLVTRYKIFARINFHHRCIKTSSALQACIRELSLDYLKNASPLCEDIRQLWESLELAKTGNVGKRIIQWNDSWLISVLHKALVDIPKGKVCYFSLKENLEEILLNKKKYYSLLKRGDDQRLFVGRILKEININGNDIQNLIQHENKKLSNDVNDKNISLDKNENVIYNEEDVGAKIESLFEASENAKDSLERIDLINQTLAENDLELLNTLIPLSDKSMEMIFAEVLEGMKERKIIREFQIYVNKGRGKLGIPPREKKWENIFLYSENSYAVFNENFGLFKQLVAIQNSVPLINIYYIPESTENVIGVGDQILDNAAIALAEKHAIRKKELFNNSI